MKRTKQVRHEQVLVPRRSLLRGAGAALALVPALQLLACTGDEEGGSGSNEDGGSNGADGGATGTDGGPTPTTG